LLPAVAGMGLHVGQPGAFAKDVGDVDDPGRLPCARLIIGIDQFPTVWLIQSRYR
jgi:hypothetical protein